MFEKHLDFSRKTSQGNREDSSFECFSSGDSVRLLVIETSSVVWRVISLYILLFCPGYTFEHPSLTDLTYPEIAVDQQLSTSLCHNRCSDIFEKKECRSVLSFASRGPRSRRSRTLKRRISEFNCHIDLHRQRNCSLLSSGRIVRKRIYRNDLQKRCARSVTEMLKQFRPASHFRIIFSFGDLTRVSSNSANANFCLRVSTKSVPNILSVWFSQHWRSSTVHLLDSIFFNYLNLLVNSPVDT